MASTIIWNLKALQQFEKAIAFIEQDSPANADKVRKTIEIYRYRISYFYNKAQVRIIRIRHTAKNPKKY